LRLTGTPFRTRADERIPLRRYRQDSAAEGLVSRADHTCGYTEALADAVVRPVVFAAYTGTSRWRNSAGHVIAAALGEGHRLDGDGRWRTALDPAGPWVPHVIAATDDRSTHLRENGMPDAAGLVLASDQDAARAYAAIVRRVTGQTPELILSDHPASRRRSNGSPSGPPGSRSASGWSAKGSTSRGRRCWPG